MGGVRLPSPRGAFRVWQRNATIFRKYWKTILLPNLFEPLLYLVALGLGLGAFIREGGINGLTYTQSKPRPTIRGSSARQADTRPRSSGKRL